MMIFIANALPINGGTTFLIRLTRDLARRGEKSVILILRNEFNQALLDELSEYVKIIWLKDFLQDNAIIFRRHLGVFGLIDWHKLLIALQQYGKNIHVAGSFGLIFALRMNGKLRDARITVGIYHQNEFVYLHKSYFARILQAKFRSIPSENVVFFNESTQKNYTKFFNKEYTASKLLPIGIELNSQNSVPPSKQGYHIISVGNLMKFKTYNMHVIRLVSDLSYLFPEIRYDIYGTGPEELTLKDLAKELGVTNRVNFFGALEYSKLSATIARADLFVGSGTALIEAAAQCRPALIGIESIQVPYTYGFLSDITGFSYNEQGIDQPIIPMQKCITDLFSSLDHARMIALACAEKSKIFSIDKTAQGFVNLEYQAKAITEKLAFIQLLAIFVSLTLFAVWRSITRTDTFGDRRNQSF
jgi:Glycosyl transferases group 1